MNLSPKLTASAAGGGLGGAIAIVIVWLLGLCNLQIPLEVAQALGTILTVLVGAIAAYLTPHVDPPAQPH